MCYSFFDGAVKYSLDIIFGVVLVSWRNCPFNNSHVVLKRISTPNSKQVFWKIGYNSCKISWSMQGNKWCNVWSPKDNCAHGNEAATSILSLTASIWFKPQSLSFLKQNYTEIYKWVVRYP